MIAICYIICSFVAAWAATRLLDLPRNLAVRVLAFVVLSAGLLLLPVQVVALAELTGLLKSVSAVYLLLVQLMIGAVLGLWSIFGRTPEQAAESLIPQPPGRRQRLPNYLLACTAVVAGCYLVFGLKTMLAYPDDYDALWYHIPLSLRWVQEGSLRLPASRHWQFCLPGNAEIGSMLALMAGREALLPLSNWLGASALVSSSYLIALACCPFPHAGWMATLAVLSLPLVQFHTFSAYVDLYGAAFLCAAVALFLWRKSGASQPPAIRRRRYGALLGLSSLACGISLGTKPVFYLYGGAFLVTALLIVAKERGAFSGSAAGAILVVIAGVLLPSAFWFGRAWAETGNPLYPMQVSIGGRVLLDGYPPSVITAEDIDTEFVRSKMDWLIYPWTETKVHLGYRLNPYSTDSGFGAVFATFIPIGIFWSLWRGLTNRNTMFRPRTVMVVVWLLLLGAWFLVFRRVPRFGFPIWVLACISAAPLFRVLDRMNSGLFKALLFSSLALTCVISAADPAQTIAAWIRTGNWTRARYYGYPASIDRLPDGSRILNRTGDGTYNYPLEWRLD